MMEYAFDGSGHRRLLPDATYSGQNTQMTEVVYFKLEVATVVGTANHLFKENKDDNNGYAAWNALCEWYGGYAVKNETSYPLWYKLESYRLTSKSNAAQYINNFLTSFRELNKITGETIS